MEITKTTLEKYKKAFKQLEPELNQMLEVSKKEATTKNGYGKILSFISDQPKWYQQLLLIGLVRKGYDQETAYQIAEIQGLNAKPEVWTALINA